MLMRAAALLIVTLPTLGNKSLSTRSWQKPATEDGHVLPDWVELYNAGSQPVNLAGYSLTGQSSHYDANGSFPRM
jgi:hypothetical protein